MSSHHSEKSPHCDEAVEIQTAQFGNRKLNARAAKLVKKMSENHQVDSINSTFTGHADTQAAYRFFNNEKVSAGILIEAHQEQILLRCQGQDRILIAQDTSELDYTRNTTLEGSGAIALSQKSHRKGFFLHAHYVMDANHIPLGIWGLDFGTFDAEDIGKKNERRHLPIEEKKSFRWLQGYRKACDLQGKLPHSEVLSLSDREGDIFEVYTEYQTRLERGERPAGFIIRAKENRALLDNETHKDIAGYLLEQDQHHESLGIIKVELRSQKKVARSNGTKTPYQREAREATLEVRAYPVTPRPPKRVGKKLPVLKLWLVTAKEMNAPEGQPPIEWTLVTNKAIATLEEAAEAIEDYHGRWGIEVFFRTLKTGCKVEKLRLKKAAALQASIALYGIIAWRLNFLVEHTRRNGDEPCSHYFSTEEWESTLAVARKQPPPSEPISLREFINEVAGLGGYLGRKSDPPPGPQALWQGLQKVFNYAEAWRVFKTLQPK